MKRIAVVIDRLISDYDMTWQDHVASMIHGYVDSHDLTTSYQIDEYDNVELLREEILNKKFSDGDKVIFTNAWAGQCIFVKHWAEIAKVRLNLIGMWSRFSSLNEDVEFKSRINHDNSSKRGKYTKRGWRSFHEYSIHRTLTKSLFMKQEHLDIFSEYIARERQVKKLVRCNFPLEYLDIELTGYLDTYYPQRTIFFPYSEYSAFQERILYDMLRSLPDIQIVFSREKSPWLKHQRDMYLTKAKVAYIPYSSPPTVAKEIYECLLLNTIPLVPDFEEFENILPKEFQYPKKWTKNVFSYSAHGHEFVQKLEELVDNYESYLDLIESTKETLRKNYYNSDNFMEQIFDVQ
jgi:hypothetical protein